MTERAVGVEPGGPPGVDASALCTPVSRIGIVRRTELPNVPTACRDLSTFGLWAGGMIAVAGVLNGTASLLRLTNVESTQAAAWVPSSLQAVSTVLASIAAGWGVFAFSRLTAMMILVQLESRAQLSEKLTTRMSECLVLLEQTIAHFEQRCGPFGSAGASGVPRSRAIADLERAAKAADWDEVEARLRDFEIDFPDDPELTSLKEDLAKTRNQFISSRLALLQAARTVNDADRVIEIYEGLAEVLDERTRATVDRELAKWFLDLIHRRLRSGKIQADLVQLAARFAESFAATVEGASVRASLATLRRSVGLCPRCAQPYTGVADACPRCLRGVVRELSTSLSDELSEQSE